ncbi:MAG: hypothetical protein A2Z03_09345 [Chloroflexi bacterium RBG_16_56_8]|nr:MAG: hypothetical protein A2Z03_09345 [Chloroflexi bacterium RBG_16_56_8]
MSGFLGTLIMLERAVALKQRWMYAVPLFAGLGWLAMLLVPGRLFGPVLLTMASLGGVAILGVIARREFAPHSATMLLGALTWLVGNILWLTGAQIFQVVFWWQAFLVLTIAGERLELNRVLKPTKLGQNLFTAIITVLLMGLIAALFSPQSGARLNGLALTSLALWSVRYDIAWRNLRHKLALTRYIAWCLALGFAWLGIGGILQIVFGAQAAGPRYDAVLHAVFVGFVISMIFGHAPIIFPAVLGLPISFSPAFYFHLALLHASLALRIMADFANAHTIRMWGGLLNAVAIILFLGMTVYSIRKSLKTR